MKNIYKIPFYITGFLYSIFFVVSGRVLAADAGPIGNFITSLQNPNNNTDKYAIFVLGNSIINQVASLILDILPVFAIIMIMYSGLQYMFAAGDTKKTESAVKMLNSSIIGFAAFLALLALWRFITTFIGVSSATP